jgi:hypothetical protein
MNPLRKLRRKGTISEDNQSGSFIKKDLLGIFNETLIDIAVRNFGLTSIVSTQEAFFKKTGKIFADDAFYDIRVSYFFDILIYDDITRYHSEFHKLIHPYKTLFDFLVSNKFSNFEDSNLYMDRSKNITKPLHSIFKVMSTDHSHLVLKDCFTKKIYPISNQKDQCYTGINRGSYVQGFIFNCEEGYTSSIGLLVHPKKCNSPIKQSINTYRTLKINDPRSLLDRMAFAQLQQFRMKHVNPFRIYKGILLEGNSISLG